MAVRQVSKPQPDPLNSFLPVAGGIIGSTYGGPAGGAIGSTIGGELASGGPSQVAMAQSRLDKQNSASQIQQGQDALKNMSPEIQQQMSPLFDQAMAQANPGQQQSGQRQKPFLPRREQV